MNHTVIGSRFQKDRVGEGHATPWVFGTAPFGHRPLMICNEIVAGAWRLEPTRTTRSATITATTTNRTVTSGSSGSGLGLNSAGWLGSGRGPMYVRSRTRRLLWLMLLLGNRASTT